MRSRRFCVWLLAAVSLLTNAAAAQWRHAEGMRYRYQAWSSWPERIGKGYFPVWIALQNDTNETMTPELQIEAQGWSTPTLSTETTVELQPNESRKIELFVPAFTGERSGYSPNFSLKIREGRRDASYGLSINTRNWNPNLRAVMWVAARDLDAGEAARLASALATEQETQGSGSVQVSFSGRTTVRSGSNKEPNVSFGSTTFEELPTRYEAYTSLDMVLVDASDGLPAREQLAPLLQWARSGGTLAILGDVAANLERGRVHEDLSPCLELRFALEATRDAYRYGLGTIEFFPKPDTTGSEAISAAALKERLWDETQLRTPVPEGRTPARMIEIPGLGELPLRTMMVALFIFALLIGPANIALVKRSGRPGLLLLTVPILSFVASGALLAYGILYQGIDVKAAATSLTILDQRQHRSATYERRTFFAGISAGSGLQPESGTSVFPERLYDRSESYDVAFGDGVQLRSSFLPVREVVSQTVLSERANRSRLAFERTADGFSVTNTFDVALRTLVLYAPGETWHVAEGPLEPGESAALKSIEATDVYTVLTELTANYPLAAGRDLFEGSYLAVLHEGAFGDDCGGDMNHLRGEHAVIGILPSEPSEWR